MIKTEYTLNDYLHYEKEIFAEICMFARKYVEKYPPLKLCVVMYRSGINNDQSMINYEKELTNANTQATIYIQRNHNILDYRENEGLYYGYTHELVRSNKTFFTKKKTLTISEDHLESIKYYLTDQVEEYLNEMDLFYEDKEETKSTIENSTQVCWIE